MVRLTGNGAERHLHMRQMQLAPHDLEPVPRKLVGLTQTAQIADGHRPRQVGAVTVPIQKVEGGGRLAHHVAADRGLPDQVIGAQETEGPRHVMPGQHAIGRTLPLDPVNEIVVEKHPNFARIAEIGQRGEEGRRFHPVVADRIQIGQGQRQRGAGDAIAHGVDLGFTGNGANLVHRCQKAIADIVL